MKPTVMAMIEIVMASKRPYTSAVFAKRGLTAAFLIYVSLNFPIQGPLSREGQLEGNIRSRSLLQNVLESANGS